MVNVVGNLAGDIGKSIQRDVTSTIGKEIGENIVKDTQKAVVKEATQAVVADVTKSVEKEVVQASVKNVSEAAVKDVTEAAVKASIGKNMTQAEVKNLAATALKDASKAATTSNIGKATKIAETALTKGGLTSEGKSVIKGAERMLQEDATKTLGKAKVFEKDAGNILTRNKKLAAVFASAGGFALYCVIKGKTPAQAANDLLSSAGQGLKDIGKGAADALGDMMGTFFKSFFGALGKGFKMFLLVLVVLIVLYIIFKFAMRKKTVAK